MIFDCHTHWGMVYADRDGANPQNWFETPHRYGIKKFFLAGHYNLCDSRSCEDDNNRIAAVAAHMPGRFYTFGTSWPQWGEKRALAEAQRCLEELGMSGLKFHPWMQGFFTEDTVFQKLCGLAGEMEAPVMFHDGTPCYSLPEQFAGLARRFPGTQFILGHSGILWSWRSALEAARQPNIWLCLCGPHQRAIEEICRRADPGRLLWGSDYGFGFADSVGYRLGLLQKAAIPDTLREQILHNNPLRLLKRDSKSELSNE